jgi:hypothetical protein
MRPVVTRLAMKMTNKVRKIENERLARWTYFQYYLDENHLKPGTKLKKGDEELKGVKPVGDDKYTIFS